MRPHVGHSLRARARALFASLAFIVLAGCAGYQPMPYENHREEGGPAGVFSGEQGEFIIYERPVETAKTKRQSAS